MKKYFLFDLDGTLTDPKVGITTCVQYALKEFGIEEPDPDKLEPFIGPPLKDSFMQFYNMSEEQAEAAVAKYRERFQDVGLFENEVYRGIPQLLHTLQSKGVFLAVASSKPTVYVEKILEHFQIRQYFKVVVGSELDGTRVNKNEVIQEALNQLFDNQRVKKKEVYMIGDRKFDVEGAKALKIECVGVTYGYGSMEELKAAKANYIVSSVEELEKFLVREAEGNIGNNARVGYDRGLNRRRTWAMLYAFLIFTLGMRVVEVACDALLTELGPSMTGALAEFLLIKDEGGVITGYTGNAINIISALGFIGGALLNFSVCKPLIQKTAEEWKQLNPRKIPVGNYVLIAVATVGAALGLNLLLELLEITDKSAAYQQAVQDQYAANFFVGLVVYGVITPIAEEALFRGYIHNYLRRMTTFKFAMMLGSLVFGIYHVNAVQGTYAFCMGCLLVYGYEYFGNFLVPVLMHMGANILAYTLSYTSIAVSGFVSWPVCIVFLVVAVAALYCLNRQKALFRQE